MGWPRPEGGSELSKRKAFGLAVLFVLLTVAAWLAGQRAPELVEFLASRPAPVAEPAPVPSTIDVPRTPEPLQPESPVVDEVETAAVEPTAVPPVEPPEPLDPDVAVEGEVVDATGAGVPDAVLLATRGAGARLPETRRLRGTLWKAEPCAETRTDAAGAFRLELPPGSRVSLLVGAAGYADQEIPLVQVGDRLRIVLTPPAEVVVHVASPAGEPVAGVTVSLTCDGALGDLRLKRRAVTDDLGIARLADLPRDAWAWLAVEGLVASRISWRETQVVNATVPPFRRLSGRVVDAEGGAPLHIARVCMEPGEVSAYSDADGQFVIERWPYGTGQRWLWVERGLYVTSVVRVGSGDWVQVSMQRASGLHGTVVTASGEAVADAVVMAAGRREASGQTPLFSRSSAVTDELGAFRLDGLLPGVAHVVSVLAPDRPRIRRLESTAAEAGEHRRLDDIVLPAARTVAGVLRLSSGAPVAHEIVRLGGPFFPGTEPWDHPFLTEETARTDHRGRFVFAGLAPGAYRLRVGLTRQHAVRDVTLGPESDVRDVEIELAEGRLVTVVVKAADGAGVGGVSVRAYRPLDGSSLRATYTDASGRAALRVSADAVHVEVDTAPSWARRYLQPKPVVLAPEADHVEFVLEPAAGVPGRIVDQTGAPVGRARVVVMLGVERVARVLADDEGRFDVPVPPGRVARLEFDGEVLHSGANGPEFTWTEAFARLDGVTSSSTGVVLEAAPVGRRGTLTVRVLSPDGEPVERASIVLIPTVRAIPPTLGRSDAEGECLFSDLRGVAYDVALGPMGAWVPCETLRVEPGEDAVVVRYRPAPPDPER